MPDFEFTPRELELASRILNFMERPRFRGFYGLHNRDPFLQETAEIFGVNSRNLRIALFSLALVSEARVYYEFRNWALDGRGIDGS